MTTGTLQDYDRLIDGGFSEQQARALVDLVAGPSRTDPAVLSTLEQILQRLDAQDRVLAMVVQEIGVLQQDVRELQQDVREIQEEIGVGRAERAEIRAEMQVIEERVKMEGRVSRMINATLIALGAIAASMAAVFAG